MTTYSIVVTVEGNISNLFYGAEGIKVYNQLLHGMDVHAMGKDPENTDEEAMETILPFHAIRDAMITAMVTEDPEVTDAVCNETNT